MFGGSNNNPFLPPAPQADTSNIPQDPKVVQVCLDGIYTGNEAVIYYYDDRSIRVFNKNNNHEYLNVDISQLYCGPSKQIAVCETGKYNDQDVWIEYYDDASIKVFDKTTSNEISSVDRSLLECCGCIEPVEEKENTLEYFEIIRLDGSLTNPAVPSRSELVNPTNNSQLVAASTMVAGNTWTLTGEYDSFTCVWLRETDQDAVVDINGIGYRAGFGKIHNTALPNIGSSHGEKFNQQVVFTAQADAFIEILVTRTIQL